MDFSLSLYSNSKFLIQINKKSSFTYPRDVVFFFGLFFGVFRFFVFFCVCKMSFSQILVMLSIATSRAFPRSEKKNRTRILNEIVCADNATPQRKR